MIGTLVNCGAVIAGGLIGLFFKKGINESFVTSINKALGVAVLIVGLNGVISTMFCINSDGTLSSSGELLLVIYLVLGTLLGEFLKLDDRLNGLSSKIENRFHLTGFSAGFVNATILFCVGAMAIIGALNDGLTGDSSILFVKSTLDFTAAIIFAASLGVGVVFSFVPVLLYQGTISLLAGLLGNILVGQVLQQVCTVGYAIIICIAVNFLATTKIKTANMLPAIFMPLLYAAILQLKSLL
ncbi:MAG: DUF554 domain-containing protein [Oscillospiraceae bacterium]|nr:DUF554 domain-containing protein [Oscillospiraceae bacterium]